MELLKVINLTKDFPLGKRGLFSKGESKRAVDSVSFSMERGQTLGIVGESGSGKSTLARCILRLYDDIEGQVIFEGQDILQAKKDQIKALRKDIQMIFQDPYSSLNPRMTAGQIVSEPLVNLGFKGDIKKEAVGIMERCGLSSHHFHRYPHEFSGGQRQRIGIARALIVKPKLVIADEPTSALDVSIQAQIMNLLKDLQEEMGLSYLFISHNLAVVKHISDQVGVMYKGRLIELNKAEEIYKNPQEDYTKKLLAAIPVDHPSERKKESSPC